MSLPKRNEVTIRKLLWEELKKKGIKLEEHLSYSSPIGRLEPDLVLQDGASYIVETKLGAETLIIKAMGQLYDYVKYTPAIGGFAIIFPEDLRKPMPLEKLQQLALKLTYHVTAMFKDHRRSDEFNGTLQQISNWISEHVLRPPVYIEPKLSSIIKTLREAVDYISISMLDLKEKDLEDIFGGKTIFENILQYEEKQYPLTEMRKAAAYLLINQIIFYHILSRYDRENYPEINELGIKNSKDILEYFKKALKVDYTSVFGFDIVSRLPASAIQPIQEIIKGIKGLAVEKLKFDLLGKIFHELIPFEIRKSVAAFYTNNEAAEFLATLSIENPHAKVMDLACGSGTLLVAAYHRKKELYEGEEFELGKKSKDVNYHKEFLEKDLTGIDIMPFAAHLASVHLSLQAPQYKTEKVRIAIWDSTQLTPNQKIPALAKELKQIYKQRRLDTITKYNEILPEEAYIKKGTLTLDKIGGEELQLEKQDVIIMNPPFTRQERLPDEYKDALIQRFLDYKRYLHGQLGLHGYFMFLADKFLKDNGTVALVLPATVLRVQSTESIRKFLSDNYTIEYIITAWKKLAFSEAAWFREILLVAKKTKPTSKSKPCIIVTLNNLPKDAEEARDLGDRLKQLNSKNRFPYENEDFYAITVSQDDLKKSTTNWFKHIAVYDHRIRDIWYQIETSETLIPFSKALNMRSAEIVRGAETKTSKTMTVQAATILSNSERIHRSGYDWVVINKKSKSIEVKNQATLEKMSIPIDAILPYLVTQAGTKKFDISDEHDYIVYKKFDGYENFFKKFPKKQLIKLISIWNKYVSERSGNLLLSRRIVLPVPGTIHLAYYSSKPIVGPGMMWIVKNLPEDYAKILSLWFNSTIHLSQVLVDKIEDVWINIHQYALNEYLVLDPSKLDKEARKNLLQVFEKYKRYEFPSLEKQITGKHEGRNEIDKVILRSIGISDDKANQILEELYEAFEKEYGALKEFMIIPK